jgi:hypothetical protein
MTTNHKMHSLITKMCDISSPSNYEDSLGMCLVQPGKRAMSKSHAQLTFIESFNPGEQCLGTATFTELSHIGSFQIDDTDLDRCRKNMSIDQINSIFMQSMSEV